MSVLHSLWNSRWGLGFRVLEMSRGNIGIMEKKMETLGPFKGISSVM